MLSPARRTKARRFSGALGTAYPTRDYSAALQLLAHPAGTVCGDSVDAGIPQLASFDCGIDCPNIDVKCRPLRVLHELTRERSVCSHIEAVKPRESGLLDD